MIKNTLLLLVCACTLQISAQQETETANTEPTINDAYKEMVTSSNSFKQYKVIEKVKVSNFEKELANSINELNTEIEGLKETIQEQQADLKEVNTNLANTQENLTTVQKDKDALSFLGIDMTKAGYKGMMWGIVVVLLAGLLFFFYRYKSSNTYTKEARKNLDEVEIEFDEYRKKALEKEQRMGRQLQDERNKLLKSSK